MDHSHQVKMSNLLGNGTKGIGKWRKAGLWGRRLPRSCSQISPDPESDRDKTVQLLLEDFQDESLPQLHSSSPQKGADREGCPAMLANDLPQVGLGDPQFKYGSLFTLHLGDSHLIRIVHQRLRDHLDKYFHKASLRMNQKRDLGRTVACGTAGALALLLNCGRRVFPDYTPSGREVGFPKRNAAAVQRE